ncbi:hypothetical protein FD755_022698, partial [Muntiacus reevesi]
FMSCFRQRLYRSMQLSELIELNLYKMFTAALVHNSQRTQMSACDAGAFEDLASIPGSGRSLGEGNGNPLQYSCLENPMDRGTWQTTVHGVTRVGHDLVTKPPPPQTRL